MTPRSWFLVAAVAAAVGVVTPLGVSTAALVDGRASDPISSLDASALRTGDLVFRVGKGWRSRAVRAASGFDLTHVGIVDRGADGMIYIVHADPPVPGREGAVRRVRLATFADPEEAEALRAFRLRVRGETREAMAARALRYARLRLPFDDAFDLSTADAMYCTELVWRALSEVGLPLRPRTTIVAGGVFGGRYMTPRDLLRMGQFMQVGRKP